MQSSERTPMHIETFYTKRREILLHASRLLRTQIEQSEHAAQFEQMLADGYSMIVVYPHFSRREPVEGLFVLHRMSAQARRRQCVVAIAMHQYGQAVQKFESFTGMRLVALETDDSREKEALYHEQGRDVPWEYLKSAQDHGLRAYRSHVHNALAGGDVIYVAPQTGRRAHLDEFPRSPIRFITREAEPGQKVGIMVLDVSIRGAVDYSKKSKGGFNPFSCYVYTFGAPTSLEQVRANAKSHGYTLDEEVLYMMDLLAADPYKVQDHMRAVEFAKLRRE